MLLLEKLKSYNLLLATQSPRRHALMKGAGFSFKIVTPLHNNEDYPENLSQVEIPVFLARQKSLGFMQLNDNEILITADTLVFLDNKVLGKPANYDEAFFMLSQLSNREHSVITGVCFTSIDKYFTFYDCSIVKFRKLSAEEIGYYLLHYHPYDKAGSYGAQDWIGLTGIEWIKGSYFNVMGLPIEKVYIELERFIG
jgi:septum formation protein